MADDAKLTVSSGLMITGVKFYQPSLSVYPFKFTGIRMTKRKRPYLTRLNRLFPDLSIPRHEDPYALLIAVLLSAQCTDERVNQVTPGLFGKADNRDMGK